MYVFELQKSGGTVNTAIVIAVATGLVQQNSNPNVMAERLHFQKIGQNIS